MTVMGPRDKIYPNRKEGMNKYMTVITEATITWSTSGWERTSDQIPPYPFGIGIHFISNFQFDLSWLLQGQIKKIVHTYKEN